MTTNILLFFSRENVVYDDIPVDMRSEAEDRRSELIENITNADEILAESYLQDKPISEDEIKKAIRRSCIKKTFTPVFVGTALKNRGVQPLLDGVVDYLPNPSEVVNSAFKNEAG